MRGIHVLFTAAVIGLLAACTNVAVQSDASSESAPSPTPTQPAPGEGVLTLEGACAVFAAIAQGLEAAERLPADQLDGAGREAAITVVGIQILQAATVYTGEFDDEFTRLLHTGPGVDFRATAPVVFDTAASEFQTLRAELLQRCEAGGYGVGMMAVTPGG